MALEGCSVACSVGDSKGLLARVAGADPGSGGAGIVDAGSALPERLSLDSLCRVCFQSILTNTTFALISVLCSSDRAEAMADGACKRAQQLEQMTSELCKCMQV